MKTEKKLIDKLRSWYIMLDCPDFKDTNADMVREEIGEILLKYYVEFETYKKLKGDNK